MLLDIKDPDRPKSAVLWKISGEEGVTLVCVCYFGLTLESKWKLCTLYILALSKFSELLVLTSVIRVLSYTCICTWHWGHKYKPGTKWKEYCLSGLISQNKMYFRSNLWLVMSPETGRGSNAKSAKIPIPYNFINMINTTNKNGNQ